MNDIQDRHIDSDPSALAELLLLRELIHAALQAGRAAVQAATDEGVAAGLAQAFHEAAVAAAAGLLRQQDMPVLLLTPDAPPLRTGHGAPEARILFTPLSAPEDFARGMPFAAFCHCCAVAAPPIGPLQPATMRAALAHPLAASEMPFCFDGTQAWTEWENTRYMLATDCDVAQLGEAAISVRLGGHVPGRALGEVIGAAHEVRCMGAASAALLAIAGGQLHAYVDLHGTLGAHDWLAAASVLRAAGGVVMLLDAALEQAPPPNNCAQRHGLVAAASRELLEEILAMLRRTWL